MAWYQYQIQILHGSLLALALKAGLSPEEAAVAFLKPRHDVGSFSSPSPVTPQLLEWQTKQVAEVLALTYGEDPLRIERQHESWIVEVTISDREPFESYGVSLELLARWIAEQLRLVCEPKGIHSATSLDQTTQRLLLTLQASHRQE